MIRCKAKAMKRNWQQIVDEVNSFSGVLMDYDIGAPIDDKEVKRIQRCATRLCKVLLKNKLIVGGRGGV